MTTAVSHKRPPDEVPQTEPPCKKQKKYSLTFLGQSIPPETVSHIFSFLHASCWGTMPLVSWDCYVLSKNYFTSHMQKVGTAIFNWSHLPHPAITSWQGLGKRDAALKKLALLIQEEGTSSLKLCIEEISPLCSLVGQSGIELFAKRLVCSRDFENLDRVAQLYPAEAKEWTFYILQVACLVLKEKNEYYQEFKVEDEYYQELAHACDIYLDCSLPLPPFLLNSGAEFLISSLIEEMGEIQIPLDVADKILNMLIWLGNKKAEDPLFPDDSRFKYKSFARLARLFINYNQPSRSLYCLDQMECPEKLFMLFDTLDLILKNNLHSRMTPTEIALFLIQAHRDLKTLSAMQGLERIYCILRDGFSAKRDILCVHLTDKGHIEEVAHLKTLF